MTGQELTQLAMTTFGYTKPAELAGRLGLTAYTSPRRVKRWIDGDADPDYAAAMALLEELGMLRAPRGAKAASEASSAVHPQSLEAQVAELSQLIRETLAELREAQSTEPATRQSRRRATGTDG